MKKLRRLKRKSRKKKGKKGQKEISLPVLEKLLLTDVNDLVPEAEIKMARNVKDQVQEVEIRMASWTERLAEEDLQEIKKSDRDRYNNYIIDLFQFIQELVYFYFPYLWIFKKLKISNFKCNK